MTTRQELVFLDPTEVAAEGRTQINIHEGAIRVGADGPDWGDYAVEQYKAKREFGEIPIDDTTPNRIINIPLIIGASGDFDAARITLQAWVGEVNNSGGGWLKREMKGGSYGEAGERLFADIVKATLRLGDGTPQASNGIDPDAHLELEALPEFYGDKIQGEEAFEATGAGANTYILKGNLPARAEITVTDKSGIPQRGLAWAARCLNYSSASTAAWDLLAQALTPLDLASKTTLEGASGTVIRHSNLGIEWTPILSTDLEEVGYLTHTGVYDVYARVFSANGARPWLRLVYDVGDLVAPNENTQIQIPKIGAWCLVYLGQVDLRPTPYGSHRWQGVIQGRGAAGGEAAYIDRLHLFCADEASGVLSAPVSGAVGIGGFAARDRFLQSAGKLTGKTAESGGKGYVAITGSDADDFELGDQSVKRTAVADSGTISATFLGRAVGLALGLGDQAAMLSFAWSRYGSFATSGGLLLKASSASNYVRIFYSANSSMEGTSTNGGVGIEVVRGGELKVYGWEDCGPRLRAGTLWAAIIGDEIFVFLNGKRVPLLTNSNSGLSIADDKLSLLPSGGVYLADECQEATAMTREYNNFLVWVPPQDAVLYPNKSAKLSHLGMYRQDSTGTAYGPVARPVTDLVRLPASGSSERPVEIAVRPSRGDFEALADSGLDPFQLSFDYWPCWSSVPGL